MNWPVPCQADPVSIQQLGGGQHTYIHTYIPTYVQHTLSTPNGTSRRAMTPASLRALQPSKRRDWAIKIGDTHEVFWEQLREQLLCGSIGRDVTPQLIQNITRNMLFGGL